MSKTAKMLDAVARFDEFARGDCPLEDALYALAQAYGAQAITLETRERATGAMVQFGEWGIDPASATLYAEHYGAISPRVAHGMRASPETIAHDDLIASPDELERTEFYGDFLQAFDLRYFAALTVSPDPSIFSVLALQFTPRAGPVDAGDIRIAQAMRPVLADRFGKAWRRERGTDVAFVMSDMQTRFGFTPSEARLAIALLERRSVVDHAARSSITANTAYTHYAALKAKLGETRQAAIVARFSLIYPAFLPH